MFKKSVLILALLPVFSLSVQAADGSNKITIGEIADPQTFPADHPDPNKKAQAKSDSDIAIGNSSYADGSADGQSGAPAMAIGNAAVATGEGSVALGSKAVSEGMGGVAIGDAAKQKNGGISIGSNANAGIGGDGPFPGMEINNSVAIGNTAKVVNGAKDSVALGANSVAGIEATQKVRFLAEDARAAQNVGDVSLGSKSADPQNEPDTFRRITNVAGGAEDTDAANIAQLSVVDDKAVTAKNTADAADAKAVTAKNTADAADAKAVTAKNTADAADAKAGVADAKAVDAKNTAVTANTTAIDARNTAFTANTTAQKANVTANNAFNLATHNSARIDKLELRYDELDDKMQRGFAMSAATANLFQPYNVGKFNLSAAVGGFNSENALAVGSGYRFNENVAVKASLATSTSQGGDVMYGAGMNLEW
ncbi:YadA-like family protein [Morganella psychrotolerans]|uniref:YadA-like family protein n=1 Tax=Morganella psychrotolerans TaxID=368603 RepID=UPI0009ED93C8|nr:YadA-like family protein [Morganella psychrotolerans]